MKKTDLKRNYPTLLKISVLMTIILLIGLMAFTPGFKAKIRIAKATDITHMIDIPDDRLIDIKMPDKPEIKPVRNIVEADDGDDIDIEDISDLNTGDFTDNKTDSIYRIYEEAPRPIEPLKPEYPEIARQFGMEGRVFVKAVVEKNGTVSDVWIIKSSGSDVLDKAAVECVRNALFLPAKTRDIALRSEVALIIDFRLE